MARSRFFSTLRPEMLILVGSLFVWYLIYASLITTLARFETRADYYRAIQNLIFQVVDGCISGSALFLIVCLIQRKVRVYRNQLPLVALSAYACAMLWTFLDFYARHLAWHRELVIWQRESVFTSLDRLFMLLVQCALFYLVQYRRELEQEREKALKAMALAQQAQLEMLRYQLNPHFLFNALNSIRAMIYENRETAREMVTELAEFLRYSLASESQKDVTIGDELQAIRNYLDIQKIRFESRLWIECDVDPESRNFVIPCFLIHPLVENAVKYGIRTSPPPLRVKISTSLKEGILRIEVSNTGRMAAAGEDESRAGTGTGIKNIRQRLDLIYPDCHRLSIVEEDGWVRARIEIFPGQAAAASVETGSQMI